MVESQTQPFCFENPTRLLILKWINTTERKLTWPDTHRPAKKKTNNITFHTYKRHFYIHYPEKTCTITHTFS